jgi:predicted ATPase
LDGIPLAVELAAARVRAMPVEQIATRLDDRFRFLTGGSRAALPRQQTLRALVDWSYDLLTDPEKTLFARLSMFAGGWTLPAAEQVCGGGDVEEWEILDLLTGLVSKSLVLYEEDGGRVRYRLLESIRQYARDRLTDSGASEIIRAGTASGALGWRRRRRPASPGRSRPSGSRAWKLSMTICGRLFQTMPVKPSRKIPGKKGFAWPPLCFGSGRCAVIWRRRRSG